MPREPSLSGLLQHARALLGLSSPTDILVSTCREMLHLTGAAIALGGCAAPRQPWEQGVHVMVAGEPRPVPQTAISALFAIHRRLSARREPLALERSSETATIFDTLAMHASGPVSVVYAVPIIHRTARLIGEIVVVGEHLDGFTDELALILSELAGLASTALESAQRLAIARRDQERLQFLAEASDEALWDWNLDTQEFWWGRGIHKLLGPGSADVLNKASWKLERIHPADLARVEESLQHALRSIAESSWMEEYRFRRVDGSFLVVEDRGYFLRESNGRAYRIVGAMRDVSPLKALLEREQEARAEAERASRAKDEFLAMLGHELRNPLAPILTAVDLLRLRGSTAIEKERTVIERQVRHMVRLVDDLLDVSRVATGKVKIQKQRIELTEVIAKALEMTSPIMEERGHRLKVHVPGHGLLIDADPARLAQVIGNLLTNAAKYTESAGTITVTAERVADSVEIQVIDTGMGIAPEMLPHVFDMFVQERQALDRSRGGLGLGLSIVRSLVTLHGGTVAAHSEGRGHGSRFTVRLPLAAVHAGDAEMSEPRGSASPATPARAGRRILIVDDNEDAAEMLAEYLQGRGNVTRVAHDGPAALLAAIEFGPEVVLLDVGLPLMNGYEVARRLREHAGYDRLRLVAVTGYGQERDRRQAQEASFDAHLVKPVSLERLEQTIRELTRDTLHTLRR